MANQRLDPEKRPSPDALLEAARRDHDQAGKLKIFVGAAPGVGKTYEMLQSAHAKLKAGIDVVVGVVETHGRAETEALLAGLELGMRALQHLVGLADAGGGADEDLEPPGLIMVTPRRFQQRIGRGSLFRVEALICHKAL